MSSQRLDKSLDEIISTQRRTSGRGRGARRATRSAQSGKPATAVAPVGGVKKNARNARGGVKSVPTGPSSGNREGKIIVSGFPKDIGEPMIKEYFAKTIGPVKRVELSFGPNSVSRGVASVTFVRSESATQAVSQMNGIAVDGRAIKVELIIDASQASSIPGPKALSERITSQPKPQPKSAAASKKTNGASGARGAKTARGGRGGRNARPAKKTAEELDSEMADYWQSGTANTETEGAANGAAQPATNGGDAQMDDEIL